MFAVNDVTRSHVVVVLLRRVGPGYRVDSPVTRLDLVVPQVYRDNERWGIHLFERLRGTVGVVNGLIHST